MEDHGKNTSGTTKSHRAKATKAINRKADRETNTEANRDTRTALILAAGELFAKQGFDGVSTRMIAEKAKVNLGAIHYHFGSKENLYVETFSFIAAEGKDLSFSRILEARKEHEEDPREKALCIRDMVFHFFSDLFESPRRDWKKRLLIQELFHPSPMMSTLAEKIMKPHNDDLAAFYQALRRESTLEEAYIWADMLYAQAFFYLMAREPLGILRKEVPLEKRFFHTVALTTARSMILLAGLPLPEDLALDTPEG